MKTCIYLGCFNETLSTSDSAVSNDHNISEWLIEMAVHGRGITRRLRGGWKKKDNIELG